MSEETIVERHQREIREIAEVLMRKYYPPRTTEAEVWPEALAIHRMQFVIDHLEPLPPTSRVPGNRRFILVRACTGSEPRHFGKRALAIA